MAPKVSALKEEYEEGINFVFLNVDNQKWSKYIRKFDVNGIPQVNLFDRNGNLKSTLIGKQEESTIREFISDLEKEGESRGEILNYKISAIKNNNNNEVNPRSHG
jgi:thioredoxin-like negative regulator of GroEL